MKIAKKSARVFVFALLFTHASPSLADCWPSQGHMSRLITWGLAGLIFGGDVVSTVGSGLTYGGVSEVVGVSTLECSVNSACAKNLDRVQANANSLLDSMNNVVAMGVAAGVLGLAFDIGHYTVVTNSLSDDNGRMFGNYSKDFLIYAVFWGLPRAGLYALGLASIFYGGVDCDGPCMETLPSDAKDGINRLNMARMQVALPGTVTSLAASVTSVALIFISYYKWFST